MNPFLVIHSCVRLRRIERPAMVCMYAVNSHCRALIKIDSHTYTAVACCCHKSGNRIEKIDIGINALMEILIGSTVLPLSMPYTHHTSHTFSVVLPTLLFDIIENTNEVDAQAFLQWIYTLKIPSNYERATCFAVYCSNHLDICAEWMHWIDLSRRRKQFQFYDGPAD